jgi:hypothetical protein
MTYIVGIYILSLFVLNYVCSKNFELSCILKLSAVIAVVVLIIDAIITGEKNSLILIAFINMTIISSLTVTVAYLTLQAIKKIKRYLR